MKEIRNKKIINGLIGIILFIVILIGGFWLINNMFTVEVKAQTYENVNYSNQNLVSPNLEGFDEMDEGLYQIYNFNGIELKYDVYSGIYELNGIAINDGKIDIMSLQQYNDLTYTSSVYVLSGSYVGSLYFKMSNNINGVGYNEIIFSQIEGIMEKTQTSILPSNIKPMLLFNSGYEYNKLQFKIQLEKGNVATDYQVSLAPYLFHQKQLSFNEGYDVGFYYGADYGGEDGYRYGYDVGLDYGYSEGYDDGLDDGLNEGYDDGYQDALYDYAVYLTSGNDFDLPEGWYGFNTGYNGGLNIGYNEGYDDGYSYGEAVGYNVGLEENPNNNFGNMISTILLGVGTVLGIELLPNITIGAIIAVPIVFGIIAFVLGRRKGD